VPVGKVIEKEFWFSPPDSFSSLSPITPSDVFSGDVFSIPELMTEKAANVHVKDKLDKMDLTNWSRHTRSTKTDELIRKKLKVRSIVLLIVCAR
jgi:hypothetical protein